MKKATVFIKGGFGNQLFQLCLANYLKESGFKVKINTDLFKELKLDTPRELVLPLNNFNLKEQNLLSKVKFNYFLKLNSSNTINKSVLKGFFSSYKFTKDTEDILNQNKNLFSLSHSPMCEMLWRQYNLWNDDHEFAKYDLSKVKDLKSKYLKEFIFNFYKNLTDKKILFDTKLSWSNINNIKMYRDIFNDKPKIIACVRNVEDIMASYYLHFDKQDRFWDL